jgi:hypothetical protein
MIHRPRTYSRTGLALAPVNRCGHTPSPRGNAPPDAARPAQPAGLRTYRHTPKPVHLLAVASRPQTRRCEPVPMTAVAPAYRCGTVADSHRVPSYDAPIPACPARCRRHQWRRRQTSCTGNTTPRGASAIRRRFNASSKLTISRSLARCQPQPAPAGLREGAASVGNFDWSS